MKKRILFTAFVLQLANVWTTYAQTYNKLSQGQSVPDVTFSILEEGKYRTAKLSDFKGKIVILDYWSIWCGSCIEAFPKLESLQKKHLSDLLILPVSFLHSKAAMIDFIKKRKRIGEGINLPVAVFENTDNPLFKSLPTLGYPFEVWIDKDGKFMKNSEPHEITESNIRIAVSTGRLAFKTRNVQMNFNRNKPLLTGNNGGPDTAFIYRSLITPYIDSISVADYKARVNKSRMRLFALNRPIIELIKISLKNGRSDDPYNQFVIFEGNDSLRNRIFATDPQIMDRSWREKNFYCYDLSLPPAFSKEKAYQFMHDDVDRFFNIHSAYETRKVKCLTLTRTDSVDRLKTKSVEVKAITTKEIVEMNKTSLETFLANLITPDSPIMFDETGYYNDVDIKVKLKKDFDVTYINGQLLHYGLKLVYAEKSLPIIVIRQ